MRQSTIETIPSRTRSIARAISLWHARHMVALQLALDPLIRHNAGLPTPCVIVKHTRRIWVGSVRHAMLEVVLRGIALATVSGRWVALLRHKPELLLAYVQRTHKLAAHSHGIGCTPRRHRLKPLSASEARRTASAARLFTPCEAPIHSHLVHADMPMPAASSCEINWVAPGFSVPDTFPGGDSLSAQSILPFGSETCTAKTVSGLAEGCSDMGVAWLRPLGYGGHQQPVPGGSFEHLPAVQTLARPPPARALARAAELRASLRQLNHPPGAGCAGGASGGAPVNASRLHYVGEFPLIGFGAAVENLLVNLVEAHHFSRQLVVGPASAPEWAPAAFCGSQRSLACYFAFSSCCVSPRPGSRGPPDTLPPHEVKRRRSGAGRFVPGGAKQLGSPGWNEYGSIFVYAQAAAHVFSSLSPRARQAVDARRAAARGTDRSRTIGMHIRKGDSCSLLSRFCPADLAPYWAAAARLRDVYGATRIHLVTDDAAAAAACAASPLGFACSARQMDRRRFDARSSIELRAGGGDIAGGDAALDVITDLEELSECGCFVLVLRSAVSRLAYALALAKQGRHAPIISMQWAWGGPMAATAGGGGGTRRGHGAKGKRRVRARSSAVGRGEG